MRMLVPPGGLPRSASIDVSDLTQAKRDGQPWWDGDSVEIPFKPEPSAAEQAKIRRRLLTRDAAEEQFVGELLTLRDAMQTDTSPTAVAVRLLIKDRLGALYEEPVLPVVGRRQIK